ncbi:hypothetical protein SAMN05216482_9260 [Streptomyces sp. PAN_FS17]|nr:hypothetical protein SAMN05216482_9260 [Streptomyces sp. PAN_FS17]
MQQVCSKVRLGHQKKMQTRQNTDTPTGGARRTVTRRYTPPPSRGAFAGGPAQCRGAGRRAVCQGGPGRLCWPHSSPLSSPTKAVGHQPAEPSTGSRVGAFAGPAAMSRPTVTTWRGSNGTAAEGGNAAGQRAATAAPDHDGTAGGGNDRREDSDRSNGGTGSGRHGDGGDGDSGATHRGERRRRDRRDEGGGDGEIRLEEGEVVAPQEDTTALASAWPGSARAPSARRSWTITARSCRPAVPAAPPPPTACGWPRPTLGHLPADPLHRAPHRRHLRIQRRRNRRRRSPVRHPRLPHRPQSPGNSAVAPHRPAKDTNGNRTDADLGTLPLYECGEPG